MGYTIYVGAGHGGSNSTPGKRTPDNEFEWNFNNVVTTELEKQLKANGFKVVRGDDRTGKKDNSLTSRKNLAEANKCSAYISIHHNAALGKWGTHGGTETFFYEGSAGSKKLGQLVHNALMDAYQLKDRGLKRGNHLFEIRTPSMISVLVEGGFMDSTIDIKRMRDNGVLLQAGRNIARAVCEYFGVSYKEAGAAKPVTASKGNYTVKDGDTLWGIAKAHNVTVEKLEAVNPGINVKALKIGSTIVVPGAEVKVEEKKAEEKPAPVANPYKGKRVESKIDGLRFYAKPSWDNKDVVGTVNKGMGFTVVDKVSVEGSYQYKVKNSKGVVYYITASDKYVKIEG